MSLIAENVGFYYKNDNWIFRRIHLKIEPNEIVGIFGYSGCGKTSLSKTLADFLKPSEGSITVDGAKHVSGTFRKVQLIYQHPEKIMNPLWRMKKILTESYIPDKEIMDTFGIQNEWLERYPIELSGGELQRFSIVRSLHPQTRYLIADEMTTMLDAITQAFIWKNILTVVKKRNIGLIVITHEIDIIKKICDRYFLMEDGKIYERALKG